MRGLWLIVLFAQSAWSSGESSTSFPVRFDSLDTDALSLTAGFLDFASFVDFSSSSRTLRVLQHSAPLPLSQALTTKFIRDVDGARTRVRQMLRNAPAQVRLNLSAELLRSYLLDEEFRAHVDALVEHPALQLSSSVSEFSLNDENLHDLAPLAVIGAYGGLQSLEKLDFSGSRNLEDITVFQTTDFPSLRYLSLRHTAVRDIAPVASLTRLQKLALTECFQLVEVTALETLQELQDLDLRGTQVADLTPLAELVNLRSLSLNEAPVQNIQPLAGLLHLQTLYLSATQVADVNALAQLHELRHLSLSDTPVVDISVLRSFPHLHTLGLSGCANIADFAPLDALTELQALFLDSTEVQELAFLAFMPGLTHVELRGSQVAPEDVLAVQDLRPELSIRF